MSPALRSEYALLSAVLPEWRKYIFTCAHRDFRFFTPARDLSDLDAGFRYTPRTLLLVIRLVQQRFRRFLSSSPNFFNVVHLPEPVCEAVAFQGRFQEKFISTSFQNLGLATELLRAVAEQGYTEATPIQSQAIPVVLSGRDLLAAAQTGTGKTAGFVLPMLQRLVFQNANHHGASHSPAKHPVRALILVPTRELAAQVHDSVRAYGAHLKIGATVIYGGVGMNPQIDALRKGVDIVVATPGRLLDHVQQRTIDLTRIEILVLDEADRMLDMGFIRDIRRILDLLPKKRQNLMFSATFSEEIRQLAGQFLHDPANIEIARRNAPIELVDQLVHPVDHSRKRALLSHLVKANNWEQVLVFAKTKHGSNRLAEQLSKDGITADAIHGNKSQPQRTRALKRFKDNEVRVLVATDIAARGIDIEALPHVVNYDLPNVPEDYVHRIGRTGRAGATGQAVSLVSREDRPLLAAIERLISRKIPQQVVPGFEADAAAQPAPRQEERRHQQAKPARRPQQQNRHDNRQAQPSREGVRHGQAQSRGKKSGSQPAQSTQAGNAKRPAHSRTHAKRRNDAAPVARSGAASHNSPQPMTAPPAGGGQVKPGAVSRLLGFFSRKSA